jgi:hypothetical protein
VRVKRHENREDTEAYLWDEFKKLKEAGIPTGPTAFAKHVGAHRTYIYKFPILAAALSAYGKQTQPSISRRGGGLSRAEAKKREVEARVRREHTKWQKELPELRVKLKEANKTIHGQDETIGDLERRLNNCKRVNEYLLMIASEKGASLSELEMAQSKLE